MQLEMICQSTVCAHVSSGWRKVGGEPSTWRLFCDMFEAVLGEEVPHTSHWRNYTFRGMVGKKAATLQPSAHAKHRSGALQQLQASLNQPRLNVKLLHGYKKEGLCSGSAAASLAQLLQRVKSLLSEHTIRLGICAVKVAASSDLPPPRQS